MLEEELIDLITFCLQNSGSSEVEEKKRELLKLVKNYTMMVA